MSNEAFPIGVLVLLVTLAVRRYRAHSREQAALKRGTQLVPRIHFDTAGWRLCETSPSASSWVTDEGDALTLNCVRVQAKSPRPTTWSRVRAHAREVAASSGGTSCGRTGARVAASQPWRSSTNASSCRRTLTPG